MFSVSDIDVEGESGHFEIKVNNSPLKFLIRNSSGNFYQLDCNYTLFAPNYPMSGFIPEQDWFDIGQIYSQFSNWLKDTVKEYFDEMLLPDHWQQLNAEKTIISGAEINSDDISKFSANEKQQLKLSINEFRLLILKTYRPTPDEIKVIDSRLEYLAESLERLNKIDWRGLAISTVMSISIALSLDTEKGKLLFGLFKQVFAKVLQLLQ